MNKVIFITAPWCATCKQIKPVASEICTKNKLEMTVLDMIDDEAECYKYNPTSLPFIVYGDRAIAGSACSRSSIEALVRSKQ